MPLKGRKICSVKLKLTFATYCTARIRFMPRVQFFRIILWRIGLSKQKLWIQISRQNEEQIKLLLRKCMSKTHERQYYRFPMTNSDQNQQNNKAQLHDEIAMVLT